MKKNHKTFFAIYKNNIHVGNIYGVTKQDAIKEYVLCSYSIQIKDITIEEVLEIVNIKNFNAIKAIVEIHYFESEYLKEINKLDPYNGFMLTPTFDYLFDKGFLSFTDDKRTILSPFLSKMTYSKLNISDDKLFPFLPTDGREKYLEYHRNNILKK